MPSLKQHALILAAFSLVGQSQAYGCYYDNYGNYDCDGMSYGARVGIAIAIVGVLLIFCLVTVYMRRRRVQRMQQQYAQNPQLAPAQSYYGQPNGNYYAPQQGPTSQAQPAQYYQQPQQGANYGADAREWQQAPPAYQPPQNGGKPAEGTASHTYQPPAGPPPNATV